MSDIFMIFSSTLTIISDVPYHLGVFGITLDTVRDVFGHPRVLGMLSTITRIDPEEFKKFRKKCFFMIFSHILVAGG